MTLHIQTYAAQSHKQVCMPDICTVSFWQQPGTDIMQPSPKTASVMLCGVVLHCVMFNNLLQAGQY